MLKRVRWIGTGAVLGAGGSIWAQQALRRRVRRLRPDSLARRAVEGARTLGADVGGALGEGRQAMREREAELRARLGQPRS